MKGKGREEKESVLFLTSVSSSPFSSTFSPLFPSPSVNSDPNAREPPAVPLRLSAEDWRRAKGAVKGRGRKKNRVTNLYPPVPQSGGEGPAATINKERVAVGML